MKHLILMASLSLLAATSFARSVSGYLCPMGNSDGEKIELNKNADGSFQVRVHQFNFQTNSTEDIELGGHLDCQFHKNAIQSKTAVVSCANADQKAEPLMVASYQPRVQTIIKRGQPTKSTHFLALTFTFSQEAQDMGGIAPIMRQDSPSSRRTAKARILSAGCQTQYN